MRDRPNMVYNPHRTVQGDPFHLISRRQYNTEKNDP